MRFTSTRNPDLDVSFEQAVLDCMPSDGGLYVPADVSDLRKWIMYTGKNTSFASIAGALTLACINEEFSPIICETIATKAFPFEPVLKKLDKRFYFLELFHGPSGSHKDFGVSYLVSTLETLLQLSGKNAVFLDVTTGELGAILAKELRGMKHVKAVLLYPAGTVCGLNEKDYVWNGGNIYPFEVTGTESDCHDMVRKIFSDRKLVEKYHLTVANTANIGRLIPQSFFYPFAFSRLKDQVVGNIYYALSAGNYSNVVAGLYSWRLALPVNGFILPSTDTIKLDPLENCKILDSFVPMAQRQPADPADPSNIERLEEVFAVNSAMVKNFIYPADVSEPETEKVTKDLFVKYHLYVDKFTAAAYAAAVKRIDLCEPGDAMVVVARDHPSFSKAYFQHCLGEFPEVPAEIAATRRKIALKRPLISTADDIIAVLKNL
ncbi:MAG: threonine synthase [Treponema sp.]|jgi:threonine synthase|nr:threonine synthase [Treponema sp.]